MHTLLENYLAEVAAHLSVLPTKRRNEELREMRAHLENAVIVSRELGHSEDDAAQFGTPQDLGDNLVWAWQRERTLNKRSLAGAVITSLVGMCLMWFVAPSGMLYTTDPVLALMERTYHWSGQEYSIFYLLICDFPLYFLIGAGSGRFFPRRAVLGTSLVVGAWAAYLVIPHLTPGNAIAMFIDWVTPALVAVASASVISRWRMRRTKRSRIVVG